MNAKKARALRKKLREEGKLQSEQAYITKKNDKIVYARDKDGKLVARDVHTSSIINATKAHYNKAKKEAKNGK